MKTSRTILLSALVTLACVSPFFLRDHARLRRLESAQADALRTSAALASAQAENTRLLALEREGQNLRKENRDLPRLRGELAQARRNLQAASNRLSHALPPPQAPAGSAAPPDSLATNTPISSTTLQASLARDQVVLVGLGPANDGRHTLGLFSWDGATPDQPDLVALRGTYLQLADSVLSTPGWEQSLAVARGEAPGATLSAAQAEQLIAALQSVPEVTTLASPRVAAPVGQPSTISMDTQDGLRLATVLSPALSPDGQSLDLTVSNSVQRLPPPTSSDQPNVSPVPSLPTPPTRSQP